MMDGIPVNDITDQLGGTVDLSTIIPFNVARVEVVRGPMSAIYGSEAVAGIVNLVTEDQPKQPWTVRLETGNFGAFEGRMVTGGRRGRLLYSLGIAGTHIGEQVERDSFDAIDSGGRAGVAIGKSTWLTLR
jgi:outer membrane cobalamin receptor